MNEFERRVEFKPGYSKRDEGYGVHGMEIRFVLLGPKGATQFMFNTGWVPGESMPWRLADHFPSATDLGFHWPRPQYEGQEEYGHMKDCDLLPAGECYYDGSGLNAQPVLKRFIAEGEPAVWEELETFCRQLAETAVTA